MYHEYPYTDAHELNLDWFLGQFKKLTAEFNKLLAEYKELEEDIAVDDSGLTDDVKIALENLLNNVAYINGNGQIYIDALHTAMYPPGPPAVLTGIACVYTQSGTVYANDNLDSLRSDLVVTASYDDGTNRIVTDYNLTGTLTVGTSVITVSYGGQTTTFNVTVSAEPIDTTPVIVRTGKIATYSSYADNPEKATYATMANGCVTIQYSLDAPSTSLYFAGIFPYADDVLSKANAVASLFALDAEGNHVSHVNEYINTGRWAQLASGTLVEFKQEWTISEYSKIMVSLDERYIDDSYLYDYNTGQVIFAGQNTPYYGMRNISEAG